MFRTVTGLLIGVMLLSTVPVADVGAVAVASRSQACRAVAGDMLGDGSQFSRDQVERYTGCALDANGFWFWPVSGTDSLLAAKVRFSDAELTRIAPLLDELLDEIALFNQRLDQTRNPFKSGAWQSFAYGLEEVGVLACSYGSGGFPDAWQQEYEEIYGGVVVDPSFVVLTGFAVWWSGSRASVRPPENDALPGAWGVAADGGKYWTRPPWPFEQERVYNQQLFFRWLLDTGQLAV